MTTLFGLPFKKSQRTAEVEIETTDYLNLLAQATRNDISIFTLLEVITTCPVELHTSTDVYLFIEVLFLFQPVDVLTPTPLAVTDITAVVTNDTASATTPSPGPPPKIKRETVSGKKKGEKGKDQGSKDKSRVVRKE